ncbi:MAG: hypothetical protein WC789_09765 [Lentisphaeria bacterium]|jgi:hypothetical protein
MQYDLNFWTEPDWVRESSMDPRFLLASVLLMEVVLLAGIFSLFHNRQEAHAGRLAQAETENLKFAAATADLERMVACTEYWQGIEAKTAARAERRLPVSLLLAAWAEATPSDVFFTNLSLRSVPIWVEPPVAAGASGGTAAKAKRESRLLYDITCQTVALGTNAMPKLTDFSRTILLNPAIAYWVEARSVSLAGGLQPEAQVWKGMPGARTTVVAKFKPLDWYDESAASEKRTR